MSGRLILFALLTVGSLVAQDPPSSVGRLSYVAGSVSFQPGGVNDWVPATINRPLTVGDQLYADADARAEIHVPGAAFRLGPKTAFEFMNLDDRNVQVGWTVIKTSRLTHRTSRSRSTVLETIVSMLIRTVTKRT